MTFALRTVGEGFAMLGIPRRYSHFVFGTIQAGLTSLIAAGIGAFPSSERANSYPIGSCPG